MILKEETLMKYKVQMMKIRLNKKVKNLLIQKIANKVINQ